MRKNGKADIKAKGCAAIACALGMTVALAGCDGTPTGGQGTTSPETTVETVAQQPDADVPSTVTEDPQAGVAPAATPSENAEAGGGSAGGQGTLKVKELNDKALELFKMPEGASETLTKEQLNEVIKETLVREGVYDIESVRVNEAKHTPYELAVKNFGAQYEQYYGHRDQYEWQYAIATEAGTRLTLNVYDFVPYEGSPATEPYLFAEAIYTWPDWVDQQISEEKKAQEEKEKQQEGLESKEKEGE